MAGLTQRSVNDINSMNPPAWRAKLGNFLQTFGGGFTQAGRVFYFDPVMGRDGNNGETSDKAKHTYQAAIDLCVADRGDVVVRMRGYYQPSETINFNVQGMICVAENFGMNFRAQGEYFANDPSNTDGPAARITKGCTIIGQGFYGAQADGDNYTAAVILDGSGGATDGYGTHLYGCRIGNWNRADVNYGIYNLGCANTRVEHCFFAGGAAYVFDAAILLDNHITGGGGRPCEMDILDCCADDCTYMIAQVNGSPTKRSRWTRNHPGWNVPGATDVKFINKGTATGCTVQVFDNTLPTATGTDTNSHSVTAMHAAGFRMSGNNYVIST